MWTLSVLIRLRGTGVGHIRYVRTIMAALLSWYAWHDASPGVLHCEESCEAMLSKVTRRMRQYGVPLDA